MHLLHEGNKRHGSEGCHFVSARPSSKEGWRKSRVLGSDGKAIGSGLEEGAPEEKC
jgi:hypothetical protein